GPRAPADLAPVRPALRDRGLLPRPARGGRAARRPEPGGLRVGPERARPGGLEPPLARRAALRNGRHRPRRPVGGPGAEPAAADRERAPGPQDPREPRDGGAGRGDAARGDALPRRPRSAHSPPQPPRAAARAAGDGGAHRTTRARAGVPRP